MRIVCSPATHRNLAVLNDSESAPGKLRQSGSFAWTWNPRTVNHYDDLIFITNFSGPGFSFGPPCQHNFMVSANFSSTYKWGTMGGGAGPATASLPDFQPFTPPYYDGYSHVEISWTAPRTDKFSLEEILNSATTSYHRLPGIGTASTDINGSDNAASLINWTDPAGSVKFNCNGRNAKQLSSSFN